jgi:hypothetical protein
VTPRLRVVGSDWPAPRCSGARTLAVVAALTTAALLPIRDARAQKNMPNSVNTVPRHVDLCDASGGWWGGGFQTVSYGGGEFGTNWRLESNSGGTPNRGTFKATSAGAGDSFFSTDRSKIWNAPRMMATCWTEAWTNTVSGITYWYTDYTSITYSGTVTDAEEEQQEETTCLYDMGCDDDGGGGGGGGGEGGGGGGGGGGGMMWQTCIYTVYSDIWGNELWRELDYCYVH